MNQILFLCTGNYYRSRFAEIIFNIRAAERFLPWRAESRGLNPDPRNAGPLSPHTIAALEKMGLACQPHLRFPLVATDEDFRRAQHIVAVKEAEHRPLMQRLFPQWLERVEFWHVHDLDCAQPCDALPHLELELNSLLDRLAAKSESAGPQRYVA